MLPLLALSFASTPVTQTNWAGINSYYLYACNATVRAEALNAVRAAGLRVLRVTMLSTAAKSERGPACSTSAVPDVEPQSIGVWDDTILERVDDLMHECSIRGIKVSLSLHDRYSLGCTRSDAYAHAYNLTRCSDPTRFYSTGRADFARRIAHVLSFKSRHNTGTPLGQWSDALFSVEAQNEAFGGATIAAANEDWLCAMSAAVRASVHPRVLVTSGGGGVGKTAGSGAAEYARAEALAECASIDVLALHSTATHASAVEAQLTGYTAAIAAAASKSKPPSLTRLVLQKWSTSGANSSAQSDAFRAIAAVVARHSVPQIYWSLQPNGEAVPMPSTSRCCVSPPGPSPSPGAQRSRTADGKGWINRCTATSCPTEVWVTSLYPAAQAAALQRSAADWPEVWGCARDEDCRLNGVCTHGGCVCKPAWRGPTCAALRLGAAPRGGGFRHANSSSWGGSIMYDAKDMKYHMFSAFMLEHCGLSSWSTNSEIIRATSDSPLGPYEMQEVVATRFAHEPNLVFGTAPGSVLLLGTMFPNAPPGVENCSAHPPVHPPVHHLIMNHTISVQAAKVQVKLGGRSPNTYLWAASSAAEIGNAARQLAMNATVWNTDAAHNGAVCDTNLAAAMGARGELVGLWRRCTGSHLHTVPHSLSAVKGKLVETYRPNISTNFPFMSHAGAEDPMVYFYNTTQGGRVFHAILHDEQITRCADAPVGCWPGGRHAFTVDGGQTWDYSPLDAYNGTVEYTDGTSEEYYLRARPHLLIEEGTIIALSNGLRPTKASEYVFTLVQPVRSGVGM